MTKKYTNVGVQIDEDWWSDLRKDFAGVSDHAIFGLAVALLKMIVVERSLGRAAGFTTNRESLFSCIEIPLIEHAAINRRHRMNREETP